MKARWQEPAVLGAAAALLCGVSLLPLLVIATDVGGAARGSFGLLGSPAIWLLLARSLGMATAVAVLAVLVGVPLGFILGRTDLPGRTPALLLHVFPMFLPPFILALGWFHLFGAGGAAGSTVTSAVLFSAPGAVLVLALAFTPVVTVLTVLGLDGVDRSLEDAARTVAGPWRVATRILLPIAWPSAALGALVVFALAFSELGVPMFLRVRTYPAAVFARLGGIAYAPGEAFVLVMPLLVVAFALLVLERRLVGRWAVPIRGLARARGAILLGRGRAPLTILTWSLSLAGTLPVVALAGRAWRGRGFVEVGRWVGSSISTSLLTAAGGATLITAIGLVAGHGLARHRPGTRLLDQVAFLAFVTPAAALGVGLISLWNRGPTAAVYGSSAILVLGYAARYSVVGMRPLAIAIGQSPPALEDAAQVAGAGYLQRLRRVVIPLQARALAGTWLLALIFCLRDLETAVLFYPPGRETLPIRIFTLEANGPEAVVAALACLHVAVTGLAVAAGLGILAGRR